MNHRSWRPVAAVLATSAMLLTAAACGNEATAEPGDPGKQTTAPAADRSLADGDWLLAIGTAGGSDAETMTTTYVTYTPATGKATARALPGVKAGSSDPRSAALLVSTDRQWAIPDTGISRAEERSGRLTVYSLTSTGTKVLDIRALSGQRDLRAVAWAFDPQRPDTLRVVDAKNRVWAVSPTGGKASQEGSLPDGKWIFTNGFNPNTGEPWVESIDSDQTQPPGNGTADTAPVSRAGGVVLSADSEGLASLPQSPCRLGAGFTTAQHATWLFCADSPTPTTYVLEHGETKWQAVGKPGSPVLPEAAALPLVLPPAS